LGGGDEPIPGCPAISWPPTPRLRTQAGSNSNRARLEGHHRSKAREENIARWCQRSGRIFISTPQGRFLDFNDALLRMTGYENREELLAVDIPRRSMQQFDRERLKKLLQQHGT